MYIRPTILNKAMATAGTEYSQAIPDNCKKLLLRSRLNGNLKLAFVAGETATLYITIPAGFPYQMDMSWLLGQTVYVVSDQNNDVLEMICWK